MHYKHIFQKKIEVLPRLIMSTGIRIFGDDDPTDSMEALAFQYQRQYIDIYSCSWGPADTGWTMEGPEQLARDQLEIGTQIVSLWNV